MMGRAVKLLRLRKAARSEDGAVTIEAVLWIPFFFILLTLVADVALIMHGQARILRIVQDENRQFAAGIHPNRDTVELAITQRLAEENLTDAPQLVETTNDGIIVTRVIVPSADLDAVGFFAAFTQLAMVVRSQHIMEN